MEAVAIASGTMARPSGLLRASIIPANSVGTETRARMFELFSRYYTDISKESFATDLSKKNHVILVHDTGDGTLQGFTTIQVLERRIGGRNMRALFSGDTIVAREYWGQTELHRAFLKYLVNLKLKNPFSPLYWFLITKGYKTYLLMARNLLKYWPRCDCPTPEWEASVIETLAKEKYGDAWVPGQGILRFKECPGRLIETVAPITDDIMALPEVRFFVDRNPGHVAGDEFCSLGVIDNRQIVTSALKLAQRYITRRR